MIDPSPSTMRRRARELQIAAKREFANDIDTAALLIFYAAECGLKAVYMRQNNLKNTADSRGAAKAAREYKHRIDDLISRLRIPASAIPRPPQWQLRSGLVGSLDHLHQAWRYGEKVHPTDQLYQWLLKIEEWAWRNP